MSSCKSSYHASRQTCHLDIIVITLTVTVDGPLIWNLPFLTPLFLFELFLINVSEGLDPDRATISFCTQQLKGLTFAKRH